MQSVNMSPFLPERAVGNWSDGTATVIARKGRSGNAVLLTAAHVICTARGNGGSGYFGQNSGIALSRFEARYGLSVQTTPWLYGGVASCPDANGNFDANNPVAISDIGIVEMDREIGVDKFPEIPRVYLGSDFVDRQFNVPFSGQSTTFPSPPWLFTGTAGTSNLEAQGQLTNLVFFAASSPGFFGLFSDFRGYIVVAPFGSQVRSDMGDSGGPITFQGPDVPVIFAVDSYVDEINHFDAFSPTWNNGNHNGDFIASFLVDADEDGVDDRFDNAPPSACPDDPFRCANPDQNDRDHDGIGDVIDNCAPSVCERRGVKMEACANAAPFHADQDGTGDACDSCALTPNGRASIGEDASRGDASQYADADGDGVGDACDNCHDVPNPFAACTPAPGCDDRTAACTSADCASGACVGFPFLGKCSVSGAPCANDAACPINTPETHESCVLGFGRCTLQNDDPDHDGLGNACESCPNDADTRVRANSNIDAEQSAQKRRGGVAALGDHCDPVPQLVSRAIVGTANPTGVPVATDPRASTGTYTTFFGTAGLGIGGTLPSVTEKAGFRRCECIAVGIGGNKTILDPKTCAATVCALAPDSYSANINYAMISTATSLDTTRLPTTPSGQPIAPRLGEEFSRKFTSEVVQPCDDTFAHRSFFEPCRVGTQRQITLWDHSADVAAGRVLTNGESAGSPITAGLVMSHVLRTNPLTVSARDSANPELRDTLEYVKTPLVDFVAGSATRQFQDCVFAGCMMTWRLDWITNPADTFRVDPTPLESFPYYERLAAQSDQSIVMLGRTSDAVFDVSSAVTPQTAALIRSGSFSFLTPVEDGVSGARGGARIATVVAMPGAWRQSAERPLSLVASGGRLAVVGGRFSSFANRAPTTTSGSAPVHPFGDPRFIPGDRDGSRAVFSGTEQAVYMVGGHRPSPSAGAVGPGGEVWRYDLAADVWRHLFVGENVGTQPGDVRAIAYDSTSGRIVIVDDGVGAGPPKGTANGNGPNGDGPPGPRFGRIVVIDTIAHKIQAVVKLPRTDHYNRIALVHRRNGEYLLLRSKKEQHSFSASAFRFGSDGSIHWIGTRENAGEMLDDPFRTPQGILVPVARNGVQDLVFVSTNETRSRGDDKHADDDDDGPEDL